MVYILSGIEIMKNICRKVHLEGTKKLKNDIRNKVNNDGLLCSVYFPMEK